MRTFAALVLLAALPVFAQPPQAKAVMKQMGHGEGSLTPGDAAPDFELRKVKSRDTVRLSSFRGRKPVALIFGSYT